MEKDKEDRLKVLEILVDSCFWFTLNMNDCFDYACADSEEMSADEFEEIAPLVEKFGHNAFLAFSAYKRGYLPLKPHRIEEFQKAYNELRDMWESGKFKSSGVWKKLFT